MTAFAARALDTMGVAAACNDARTVVVVGNGMVGHRFCERLATHDRDRRLRIVCFGEERRAAYDRVHLTAYMSGKNADALVLADAAWYASCGITLHLGERVIEIDRTARIVVSSAGRRVAYDALVLATGSAPFVPAIPGVETPGVFVYRTIEDLDAIRAWSARARRAAVIGGGLLGLEAAKAVHDLGLEVHVVEFAPRLMPRQVDAAGGEVLRRKIAALGVHVHTGMQTQAILGTDAVTGLRFAAGDDLVVDMVVVSAGIRPRDELARTAGLEVGPRGGIVVDAQLRTSDPDVFCIGESALAGGMIYGLVGPGYEMAEGALRRHANLLLQQREQGRHPARHRRREAVDRRRRQGVHQGGHGLRRLRPAGGGAARGRARGRRPRGEPQPVRALRLHAPGAVRDREARARAELRRAPREPRHRQRLRGVPTGGGIDPGEHVERLRPEPCDHPGHQRPLPRQHPARRYLLGRAAHPGRRDPAREADRPRRSGEALRPLLQDHGWAADRPARRARRAVARHLGGARRRR